MPSTQNTPILIVEDSPTQAIQLEYQLAQGGYEVTVAKNGENALEILQEIRPSLIISDIVMPEMDGYELCLRIKNDEVLRQIPVILLTALSEPDDVVKGLESGADNFITKPYNEAFLLSRVHQVLLNRELRRGQMTEMGIEIYFAGKRHNITSNRLQIIDLLFSTFENAIEKNKALIEAQRELKALNDELEEKVQERTRRIEHLNQLLKAIRNINQLIVKEKNRDRLLKQACQSLIDTRQYYNAWVALYDESGNFDTFSHCGFEDESSTIEECLKQGMQFFCLRRVQETHAVTIIEAAAEGCRGCPLCGTFQDRKKMMAPLEHGGRYFGLVKVTMPGEFDVDEEEVGLFEEVAGDLGYALFSMDLEKKRKAAEAELAESEERYRSILDNIEEGYGEVDLAGNFVFVNDAMCRIMGYERNELLGMNNRVYTDVETAKRALDLFNELYRMGKPIDIDDYEIRRKDGTRRILEMRIFLISASEGIPCGFKGVFRDVTERKQAE